MCRPDRRPGHGMVSENWFSPPLCAARPGKPGGNPAPHSGGISADSPLGEYRDRGETIFFYQEKPDREGRLGALLRQSYSYPYILQNQYLRLGEYEKMNLKERRMEYITFEGCSFRDVSFEAASPVGSPVFWSAASAGAAFGRQIWPWPALKTAGLGTRTGRRRSLEIPSFSRSRRGGQRGTEK